MENSTKDQVEGLEVKGNVKELLEKLKFELAFVEDGGYGRSVRTPHQSTSPFQDSLTCLNFGDPSRTHPCAECVLMQYVPESRKGEDVPCHYIPLDQESRTIATLDAAEAEEVLKRWLRHEINRLQGEPPVVSARTVSWPAL